MLCILFDYLVDVMLKFKLRTESFVDACYMVHQALLCSDLDRLSRYKLQLLGLTCLNIACKVNEIYSPEFRDFVYVCDRAYSSNEFIDMERRVLWQLKFDVQPTTHFFYAKTLSHLFLEPLSEQEPFLQDYICCCICVYSCIGWRHSPIHLALAVLQIARLTLSNGQSDLSNCEALWKAVDCQMQDIAPAIEQVLQYEPDPDTSLRAAKRFYQVKSRLKVSALPWIGTKTAPHAGSTTVDVVAANHESTTVQTTNGHNVP